MSPLYNYKIFSDPNLKKSIEKNLPEKLRKIFDKKIKYFSENPFYPSLNTKKYNVSKKTLKRLGVDGVWEFYINRHEYRCIFYTIDSEQKIIIINVGNHEQIKRKYS